MSHSFHSHCREYRRRMGERWSMGTIIDDNHNIQVHLYLSFECVQTKVTGSETVSDQLLARGEGWYVAYDSLLEYGHPMLYSKPYCLEWYPFYDMIGTFVTQSTGPEPASFPHVSQLDMSNWLSMNYTLLHRCTQVNQLDIDSTSLDCNLNWRYLITQLNTSIITSLCIDTIEIRTSIDATVELMCNLPLLRSLLVSVSILKMLLGYDWPRITQLWIVWGSDRLPK